MNLPLRFSVISAPVNRPMRSTFQLLLAIVFAIGFFQATYFAIAKEIKFGLPIKCELNKDCFIQNLPDVVTNKSALDTFCQGATYDGHKGIDIRIHSLRDMERNVPVIASADGIVKAYRDGEIDKIIATPEDRLLIQNKECGNGVVIVHEGGYETQVCHLKQNSISVEKGDQVKKGDTLGFVGNSGFAAFPHVHLSIRKDGKWLDPITGLPPSGSCTPPNTQNSLLDEDVVKYFEPNTSRLIASGISGNAIEHKQLVRTGSPAKLNQSDQAVVGWAWFINLRKGDQIRYILEGPKGIISENTSKPLDRHKATYSGYSGKKGKPTEGEYRLTTQLLRNGKPIHETLFVQTLE
jgi:hypothetical protein